MIEQIDSWPFLWRKTLKMMDGEEGRRPQLGCNVLARGRELELRVVTREV